MTEENARQLQVRGHALRLFEKGSGEAVVLLHGGGADSALLSWGKVFDPLAEDLNVYAPDWPGYGGSEPINEVLTNELLLATLDALLARLDLDSPHLVGISMGGEAALAYALAHPDRVKTMTLVGSGAMQERAPYHALAWPILHMPLLAKPLAKWQWRMFARSPKLLERSLRALLPSWQEIPGELVQMIQDELNGRSKPEVFFEWQADEVRFGGLRTNFTPRLGELSMPVKLLHGDKDIAVPVKYARRAAQLIPGAVYREFAGCGHWLPRERPEDVVDEVRAFVGEGKER
ncbi:MAG: alpha/beta fold hydrolase [Spirochaetota bacterium]